MSPGQFQSDASRLMRHAADLDLVLHVQVARDEVVVHAQMVEHRPELVIEPLLGDLVARRVAQADRAVSLQRDPILGAW